MIRVVRPNDGPIVLGEKGPAELRAYLLHQADPNKQGAPFEFKVYADDAVKSALEGLFHGKCAYCEWKYKPGYDGDIEHYRPKGAVIHKAVKTDPGYYWLAASWLNLLPACQHCNQRRVQEFYDQRIMTTGKGMHFPLKDEGRRAFVPGDEQHEEPLLLNPCEVDPSDHLDFKQDGSVVWKTVEGETTIHVLGLQRKFLKEQREQLALLIRQRMNESLIYLERIERYSQLGPQFQTVTAEAKSDLQRAVAAIKPLLESNAQFSALGRALAQKWIDGMASVQPAISVPSN